MQCFYNAVNFPTNIHKTPQSSPVRASYGECFMDLASGWYCASVPVIIYVISWTIFDCVITALGGIYNNTMWNLDYELTIDTHTSPWWVGYGMTVVIILENIEHVMTLDFAKCFSYLAFVLITLLELLCIPLIKADGWEWNGCPCLSDCKQSKPSS